MTSRRAFLTQASTTLAGSTLLKSTLLGSTLSGSLLLGRPHNADAAEMPPMLMRKIPTSGEPVPVIGLGTSGSFEISADSPEYAALKEVLKRFFGSGASLIDTAPTYGNAENILGPLLAETNTRRLAFIATKLSRVTGKDEGLAQFRGTLKSLQTDKVELLQVHNLNDWKTQIELARQLKAEGKVKYVGVTHYQESGQEALADVVQETKPDFLQINYSVTQRGAEKRVLPMARDLGIAVLANRNFDDGALFAQVKDKELPGWAVDLSITSWAQMFLKFVLSNDAVTAVIPATGKPERESDNLRAGFGPLLTAAQKSEVIDIVG
jgi:aryl-alcohol dehydrogenase-like predicted oxidoreductase